MDITDIRIIELFTGRSKEAVSALSKKYEKLCRSISYNILRNKEDAEECVNDTYLKVFKEESGIQSYGEVAVLLIAWYLKEAA